MCCDPKADDMWEVTDYRDNYLARPGFFGFPKRARYNSTFVDPRA